MHSHTCILEIDVSFLNFYASISRMSPDSQALSRPWIYKGEQETALTLGELGSQNNERSISCQESPGTLRDLKSLLSS
jgi:hypothetical protein